MTDEHEPAADAALTFLQPTGAHAARKVHRLIHTTGPDTIETQGYGKAYEFRAFTFPVRDIEDLAGVLEAQAPLNRFAIRGQVRLNAPAIINRRIHGEDADLVDQPSAIIPVDLDTEPAPDWLDTDDIILVGDYLRGRLPPELREVSCIVQLSASYGLGRWKAGPPLLKARLWFINNELLDGGQLRRWFRDYNTSGQFAAMDVAVAGAAQPIYTAAPRFEGMTDPVSVRLALLLGSRDTASIRAPVAPERPAPTASGNGPRCPGVLGRCVAMIENAQDGEKHTRLNDAAYLAGGFVAGGACTLTEARATLRAAIERKANVADLEAAYQTIDSGLHDGQRAPVTADTAPPDNPDPADLNERSDYAGDLLKLRATKPAQAWATASTILNRYTWQCPWQRSFSNLADDLLSHLPNGVSSDLPARIRRRVTGLEQQARRRATASSTLDRAVLAKAGVTVVEVADIAAALVEVRAHPGALTLIKADLGVGKTEQVLKPLALDTEGTAVAITHRVSLVADLCHRLDLDHYQTVKARDMETCVRLGVCLKSILNPKFADPLGRAATVLVDEIAAVTRECHSPSGVLGKHAKTTWARLTGLLSRARVACGGDADLSTADVLALQAEIERPVRVVTVQTAPVPLQVQIGGHREIWQAILDAAAAGEPFRVFSDSAGQVRKLDALLRERHPESRIMAIHAGAGVATTGRPDVVTALRDLNHAVEGLDVLLHSPAVETGVSLTTPRFTRAFGLYCGSVSPSAFVQMMRRDRTAAAFDIGIVGNGIKFEETRPGAILANMAACHRRTVELAETEGGYHLRIEAASPWDARCAQQRATTALDTNRYPAHLWLLLEARGAQVNRFAGAPVERATLDAAADLTRAEYRRTIEAAPDIDADEREAIRQTYQPSPAEAAMAERYDLLDCLKVDEVTPADLDVWDEGNVAPKVRRFAALMEAPLAGANSDADDAAEAVPLAARRNRLAICDAIKTAFEVLGFDPASGSGELDAATALEAFHDLKASPVRAVLEHAGLSHFDRAPRYSVRWAGDFLDKLGLGLICDGQHRTPGGVIRRYTLAMEPTYDKARRRMTAPGWRLMCDGAKRAAGCHTSPLKSFLDVRCVTAEGITEEVRS